MKNLSFRSHPQRSPQLQRITMSTIQIPSPALRAVVFTVFLALGGFFWAVPRALGAGDSNPPERMSYQGYLVDATGTALATNAPKNYDVVFRLYDVELNGTAKWEEQQ